MNEKTHHHDFWEKMEDMAQSEEQATFTLRPVLRGSRRRSVADPTHRLLEGFHDTDLIEVRGAPHCRIRRGLKIEDGHSQRLVTGQAATTGMEQLETPQGAAHQDPKQRLQNYKIRFNQVQADNLKI